MIPKITFETWCWIALALMLPALLINLGLMAFIEDESIRALVALEMRESGNYLVPTMNGSLYHAKPPLYNWILCPFYILIKSDPEWASRLPTVLWVVGIGFLMYAFSRSQFRDKRYAVLSFFFFVTCGRVLFWDSFLGLIDLLYSLVIFLMMMLVFHYGQKARYTHLFLFTYVLGIIGYFLKGFPVFLFIGCSLLAYAYVKRAWRFLFHWSHLLGILMLAMTIGAYYYIYGEMTDATSSTIRGLAEQSTMRTPLSFGLWPVIKHLFTYPFEYIYHYLPWTLFAILLVRKDVVDVLMRNTFIYYCAVCFMANIWVYWVSPQVYARYVLMLVPLTYLVFLHFYQEEELRPTFRIKILRYLIIAIVVLIPLGVASALFNDRINSLQYGTLFVVVGVVVMSLCAFLYIKYKQDRPILLVIVLLCLRIGFDVLVLPSRHAKDYGTFSKSDAIRIGEKYRGKPLQLYQSSDVDYTSSFYLSYTRDELTYRSDSTLRDEFTYILDTSIYTITQEMEVVDSIKKRENRETLFLVKSRN